MVLPFWRNAKSFAAQNYPIASGRECLQNDAGFQIGITAEPAGASVRHSAFKRETGLSETRRLLIGGGEFCALATMKRVLGVGGGARSQRERAYLRSGK